MINIDCQLDKVWNHLWDEPLSTSGRGSHDWAIWSGKPYPKCRWRLPLEAYKEARESSMNAAVFPLYLTGELIYSAHECLAATIMIAATATALRWHHNQASAFHHGQKNSGSLRILQAFSTRLGVLAPSYQFWLSSVRTAILDLTEYTVWANLINPLLL